MLKKKNNVITICFLSHSSGNAGAEKAFPKLLEGLKRKGIKIYVFLPSAGPVVEDLNKRGLDFEIVHYPRWLNSDSNYFKRIKRTIKNLLITIPLIIKLLKLHCDLIYTNTSTICVGGLAAKLIRRPHIWHFREFGLEDYGYTYDLGERISHWLTNKLSTICLVNSSAVALKYKQFIPGKKLKVIYESYNNSNLNESPSYPEKINYESGINCVIVGTLIKGKGHGDAIKAIHELHRIGVNAKLYIIGDGEESYKSYLIKLVEKFNLNKDIKFLGYLDNPQIIVNQCDTLLMCSKNEAFGLVTLEALQLGKPVIGSKSGGTTELIKDGFNGLFYTPGDYKELSEKIKFLSENPEIAKKMGENAKNWAKEKFDPEQYINETFNVIKQLVKA